MAARRGAPDLPISVKTRLGFNEVEIETWIPALLKSGLEAITIHGRTRKELSKVPARWEEIARAAKIARRLSPETLVIGNGDVRTLAEAKEKTERYKLDGVMVGRAVLGQPWFFTGEEHPRDLRERLDALLYHATLFDNLFGKTKNFLDMRKHAAAYVSGVEGAKDLRVRLLTTSTLKELRHVIVGALSVQS